MKFGYYTRLLLVLGSLQILVFYAVLIPLLPKYEDIGFRTPESKSVEQQHSLDLNLGYSISSLKLLYMHVGKTGGMTLDRILRSNCEWHGITKPGIDCNKNLLAGKDELFLSKVTTDTFHMSVPTSDELKEYFHSHELLWTLRNPIRRFVSAFDMRANNVYVGTNDFWADVFYEECGFRTAQKLADKLEFANSTNPAAFQNNVIQIPMHRNGGNRQRYRGNRKMKNRNLASQEKTRSFDCYQFGKGAIEGKEFGFQQIKQAWWNYERYTAVQNALPNKTNFVLRTEHLWADVIQTNQLLLRADSKSNSKPSFPSNDNDEIDATWISNVKKISSYKNSHGSEGYEIKSRMTQRGKEILCCYLSDENQIYENLLLSAVNLNDQQKAQSLESLYRDCGIPPSQTTSVSLNGGFGWKEWRSEGCPTQTVSAGAAIR